MIKNQTDDSGSKTQYFLKSLDNQAINWLSANEPWAIDCKGKLFWEWHNSIVMTTVIKTQRLDWNIIRVKADTTTDSLLSLFYWKAQFL